MVTKLVPQLTNRAVIALVGFLEHSITAVSAAAEAEAVKTNANMKSSMIDRPPPQTP